MKKIILLATCIMFGTGIAFAQTPTKTTESTKPANSQVDQTRQTSDQATTNGKKCEKNCAHKCGNHKDVDAARTDNATQPTSKKPSAQRGTDTPNTRTAGETATQPTTKKPSAQRGNNTPDSRTAGETATKQGTNKPSTKRGGDTPASRTTK